MVSNNSIDHIRSEYTTVKESLKVDANTVASPEQLTQAKHKLSELKTILIDDYIDKLAASSDQQEKEEFSQAQKLLEELDQELQGIESTLNPSANVSSTINGSSTDTNSSRMKDQRDKVWDGTEWKEKPLQNAARVAGGVALAYGARQGAKWLGNKIKSGWNRLWGKKDEQTNAPQANTNEEPGRFSKNLPWLAGGAAVVGGVALYWDKIKQNVKKIPVIGTFLDELLNPESLTIEQATVKVASELNQVSEDHLKADSNVSFERIDEHRGYFHSYGTKIEVNEKDTSIPGLDITFDSFEELLHAANLVNCATVEFRGRCKKNPPFYVTKRGGDIGVDKLDEAGTDNELVSGASPYRPGAITGGVVGSIGALATVVYGGRVGLSAKHQAIISTGLITGGAVIGNMLGDYNDTLSQICPTLNHSGRKDKFMVYLNNLGHRTQGKQEREPDTKHALQPYINQLLNDVESIEIEGDFTDHGEARGFTAEIVPGKPHTYVVNARNKKREIVFDETSKTITIEGFPQTFPVVEGLRWLSFVHKMMQERNGKTKLSPSKGPFSYHSVGVGGNDIIGDSPTIDDGLRQGIHFSTGELREIKPDRVLRKSTIKNKYPTVLQHIDGILPLLNKMKDSNNMPYWKK